MAELQSVTFEQLNRDIILFPGKCTFEMDLYLDSVFVVASQFSCPHYYLGILLLVLLFNTDSLTIPEQHQLKECKTITKISYQVMFRYTSCGACGTPARHTPAKLALTESVS